ncbi:unnamed protein product [Adineta ricciae]|uniref:Uncharacterized protein n=1 Tax=Adineta ricciae TaxID=249248 RepID=A0A815UZQ1_ADIRI|nr:unnamed protein product [Adineta ricciae]
MWSSDVQLKLLFDCDKLYMDGPFSTSPSNFDQVYIFEAVHHGPLVYRNIQFKGLSSTYLENLMVHRVIRRMMMFALVPEQLVLSLFAGLYEEPSEYERDELKCVFTYFEH